MSLEFGSHIPFLRARDRFRIGILSLILGISAAAQDGKVDLNAEGKMTLPASVVPPGYVPFFQDEFSGRTVENLDMASQLVYHRFFNAPGLGTKAPAFALVDNSTRETVLLKDLHREKPVVLFFGSLGCDVMADGVEQLLEVYREYREEVNFVMVYIREAHSVNGFGPERASVEDPETNLERSAAARQCRETIGIPFRILLDTMDDRAATRWAAWPLRLYAVDTDGTVIYTGKPGPWGFNPGGGFVAKGADGLRAHSGYFSQESLEEFLSRLRGRKD